MTFRQKIRILYSLTDSTRNLHFHDDVGAVVYRSNGNAENGNSKGMRKTSIILILDEKRTFPGGNDENHHFA